MIVMKGFLRHRITKLYISIIVILITSISLVFACSEYYSKILSKVYKENSYFLVTGNSNLTSIINENNHITKFNQVVLLEPEKILFSDNSYDSKSLLDFKNERIIIASDKYEKEKLNTNQAIIELPKFVIDNTKDMINFTEKSITIINLNSDSTFEIVKIKESNSNKIMVSESTFNNLIALQQHVSYIFWIDDYNKISDFTNQFESENIEVKFIECYEGKEKIDTVESLKKTITILSTICELISIGFILLSLIIYNNLISDEAYYMNIERLLGYTKKQIKKYLALKIFSMNLIIGILSIIFQFIIFIVMKMLFQININIYYITLFSICFLTVISLILCCIHRINN